MIPRIVVNYGFGSASPTAIARSARENYELIWHCDLGDSHCRAMAPILARLGTIVTTAPGATLDERCAALGKCSPDGIVTFCDALVWDTGQIARRMGLPYHSLDTARSLTDKYEQRQVLASAGIQSIRFQMVKDRDALRAAALKLGGPLIAKPVRGQGSRHTFRIGDLADLKMMMASIDTEEIDRGFIVEEEIQGIPGGLERGIADYVSVETVSRGAVHWVVGIVGRLSLAPPFRERGWFYPSTLEADESRVVRDLAVRALTAIGVSSGVSHTEIKLTPHGPEIVEVNGRLGGHVWWLIGRHGGTDLIDSALRSSLGLEARARFPQENGVSFRHAPPAPMQVGFAEKIAGVADIRAITGVEAVELRVRSGAKVDWREGTGSCLAEISGVSESHQDMVKITDHIERLLQISIKSSELRANCDGRPAALRSGEHVEVSSMLHQLLDDSVVSRFEDQVTHSPNAIALIDGGRRINYAQLAEEAASVARTLSLAGVPEGSLVGISMSRGWRVVAGILGVWRRRCAYVPIDPTYPERRRRLIAEDARLSWILTEGADRRAIVLESSNFGGTPHDVPVTAAYVIYTSGSTGRPKGVVVTHENLKSLLDGAAQVLPVSASDVGTVFHSYCFDFSVWEMWRLLTVGARCVHVPVEATLDPHRFARLLADEEVSVLNLVPSVFANLVHALGKKPIALSALREVIFGGEQLNINAARKWYSLGLAPRAQLVNMYGITETTVHVTAKHLKESDFSDNDSSDTPIGRPLPHLRVLILDGQGQVAAPDGIGEMYVAGSGVSAGYLGLPTLTDERFVPLPFDNGSSRWYKTGDMGRLDARGELHFVGRRDNQVQLNGHRVELGEIEVVLSSAPEVSVCAVVTVPNGKGAPILVGCYVPTNESNAAESRVRGMLLEQLPRYMVPPKLIAIRNLPVTPEGKLDRTLLREIARNAISKLESAVHMIRGGLR